MPDHKHTADLLLALDYASQRFDERNDQARAECLRTMMEPLWRSLEKEYKDIVELGGQLECGDLVNWVSTCRGRTLTPFDSRYLETSHVATQLPRHDVLDVFMPQYTTAVDSINFTIDSAIEEAAIRVKQAIQRSGTIQRSVYVDSGSLLNKTPIRRDLRSARGARKVA